MNRFSRGCRIAAVVIIAFAGIAGSASAQDKNAVIKDRQATMRGQGKALGSVKAYLGGTGDAAQAEAGATSLVESVKRIPSLFPPGSDMPSPSGKYAPKPAIWSDWDKFLEVQKAALAKSEALLAAVKSGGKAEIQTAFADLGKNGCGACHTNFRETLKP